MNILPSAWVNNLSNDEIELYGNLAMDEGTGLVKPQFVLRKEMIFDLLDLEEIYLDIKGYLESGYDDFFHYTNEVGQLVFVVTGTSELTSEERVIYDSLIVKIQETNRKVLEEQISSLKNRVVFLEKQLENTPL